MTTQDNAFTATGIPSGVDFFALPGKPSQPASWGFVTALSEFARFSVGGSFNGVFRGVEAWSGNPDDQGRVGPTFNNYSLFAGVQGTGVDVTGVAGTSINHVGVLRSD
jgi:hypothetical protein